MPENPTADHRITQPSPEAGQENFNKEAPLQENGAGGHPVLETLVAQLATRFIYLPPDEMGHKLEEGLKLIVEFLNIDRCSLLEPTDDGAEFVLLSYSDLRGEAGDQIARNACIPWSRDKLRRGETIILSQLPDDLPEEAKADHHLWLASGVKSCLGLPLTSAGKLFGVLFMESFRSTKSWPPQITRQLTPISDIFYSVLKRNKAFLESNELLRFEKLLSEISSMYANLPSSEVDKTIEDGLRRIGKFLGSDRCNLGQFSKEMEAISILHSWSDEGIEPMPSSLVGTGSLFPWSIDRLKRGDILQYSRLDDLPDEAKVDKETLRRLGIKSGTTVPIAIGGPIVGFLEIDTVRTHRSWPVKLGNRLRLLGEIFANALVRKEKELEIQKAFAEIKKLNGRLEADCTYLREEIDLEYNSHNMIGQSDLLKHIFLKIEQVASTDITVLVSGETGTGKELVARAIHAASPRKDRPMVKVNCAALPASLIESELFGHEQGAFTSAQARQVGRFELAHGNTLLLDEIGELPLESQAKLLRVLQEGEFERLGSTRTIKVDVRIIAATNRDLEEEVRKGRFRQDLWYRLNVFPITVPPLRQRREDVSLLVNSFVEKFNRKLGKRIDRVPDRVMNILQNYHWPGNVRELENVIERAAVNTPGSTLQLLDNLGPAPKVAPTNADLSTLDETERDHIIRVLEQTNWRISGPQGAALILGLNHSTLRYRMRKLGIQIKKSTDVG